MADEKDLSGKDKPDSSKADDKQPDAVPYARFREVNEKNKELAEKLKVQEAALSEKNKAASEWETYRASRVEQVKGDMGDSWEDSYSSLSLEALERLRDKLKEKPKPTKGSKPGFAPRAYTFEQLLNDSSLMGEFLKNRPDDLAKLRREYFRKKGLAA